MINIVVPPLGESIVDASIAKWHFQPNQLVPLDALILELETDKVTLEVYAPASGLLKNIFFKVGESVKPGMVVAEIEAASVSEVAGAPTVPETPDIVNAITDDFTFKIPGLDDNDTDIVLVKAPTVTGAATVSAVTGAAEPVVNRYGDASTFLSAAKGYHEPLELIGTSAANSTSGATTNSVPTPTPAQNNNDRAELRLPMSRLRQKIAMRLKDAQNSAAILTTFNEVDMSAIINLRNNYKVEFEKKHQVKLGFMGCFVKACVTALQAQPIVNSVIDDQTIVTKNYFDIGVAISSPNGLVVPIIRNANNLSVAGIEQAIANLAKRARDGKLTIEEMTGGTFTITNGGIFGSLLSTPIINPPQSAILGMHKIQERPVAINGQVVIRPMMYLALSYDHRLIDGKEAVTFLVTIKDCLENPGRYLLEL